MKILSIVLYYFLIAAVVTIIQYSQSALQKKRQRSLWFLFVIVAIGCFLGGLGYYFLNSIIIQINRIVGVKLFPPIVGGVAFLSLFKKLQDNKNKDK